MTRPIWFKAKRYGYGWYPATWQGWLIMLVWVVLITITAFQIDANSHSVSDTLIGIVPLWLFYTVILIVICVLTGEKARWRWGE